MLLIAALLGVRLITVSLVTLTMRSRTAATVATAAEEALVRLADRVVEQTRRWLEPAGTVLGTVARLTRGGTLDVADDATVAGLLPAELGSRPRIDALYLGRADGTFVMADRGAAPARTKTIAYEPGPDGGDAGVLGIDIDIRALSRFVAHAAGASSGSAMIVDATGEVAAYSDVARWNDARPDGRVPTVADIGDAALAELFGDGAGSAGCCWRRPRWPNTPTASTPRSRAD